MKQPSVQLARAFAFLIAMATFPFNAVEAKDYCAKNFCIRTILNGESTKFIAENRDRYASVSTNILLELTNLKADHQAPHRYVLAPLEKRTLFTLSPKLKGKWNYKFNYYWRMGDFKAHHDNSARYLLPIKPGSLVTVSQGCHQIFSHNGKSAYATDFLLKVGTPIHAAREGTIVSVREDSNKGGKTKSFAKFANHIYVQHADGTIAIYLHLKKNGIAVELGQKVRTGELIGYSGNTGWSTNPHLHFEVVKPENKTKLQWQSIRVTYQTTTGPVTCPNKIRLTAKR